jgi:hypothetical protein
MDRATSAHGHQDAPVAPDLLAWKREELAILRTDPFTGWDQHHIIPQFVTEAWESAGIEIPTYISQVQVYLPNAYHQVVHNAISVALQGVNLADPNNVQRVPNLIQGVYEVDTPLL